MLPMRGLVFIVAATAACSSPSTNDGGTESGTDTGVTDVSNPSDATMGADGSDVATTSDAADVAIGTDAAADVVTADVTPGGCGTSRPDVSGITGTEGLVIAADGTIYYSQRGAVGRMQPGMPQDDAWVTITGATTIWGLALDVANHRLYVGSPATARIYTIDLTAATPTATMLGFAAGQPNGLTMGPDGAMYYSDFGGGNVWRVDGTGTRTRVTTTTIAQANGVAFGADGALYVDSYGAGTVVKLTLASGMETARMTFATGLGSPDGIAFDATGRLYVTDNAGGRLIRLNADGTSPMVLATGVHAAANIEFGIGDLICTDIYVATSGSLLRYQMGTTPGADVPWHH